jgi:hypothetical protein
LATPPGPRAAAGARAAAGSTSSAASAAGDRGLGAPVELTPTSAALFFGRFSPGPHVAVSVTAAAFSMGTPVPSTLTTSSAPADASGGLGRCA